MEMFIQELLSYPTELYESFDLGKQVGDLKEKINNSIASYQEDYGKLTNTARLAHGTVGLLTTRGIFQLLNYTPTGPYAWITKIIFLPTFAYLSAEFLGSALTAIDAPIEKYFKRRKANHSR